MTKTRRPARPAPFASLEVLGYTPRSCDALATSFGQRCGDWRGVDHMPAGKGGNSQQLRDASAMRALMRTLTVSPVLAVHMYRNTLHSVK